MTVQAHFRRLLSQHAGIFAGMLGMTRLAVAFLDRFVLCGSREIFMTRKAESTFKRLKFDGGAFQPVAVVTIATANWRMHNLL
jgi:hypothetical protein